MNTFKVTKDKKVFVNGVEIERVQALDINIRPLENPTITLIVSPDCVDIDEYMDEYGIKRAKN